MDFFSEPPEACCVRELLFEMSQGFRKQNIETARLDAELLLSHTLKKKEFSFSVTQST